MNGKTFVTDDQEGYRRVVPQDQVLTGKNLTFPGEQDNSNVRNCFAHLRHRTKVVSMCRTMVDLSPRLLHYLKDPQSSPGRLSTLQIFSVRIRTD